MFKLPLLDPHDQALQKCVYCPKLSRAACPVSNVEANETVTPWGKMSLAYFAGRGDVPIDAEHAESAWACSGCYACRERCEHKNEVATVLGAARGDFFAAGVAPPAASALAARFGGIAEENRRGVDAIDREARQSARVALLIGCSYVRTAPEVAEDAWRLAGDLLGVEVRALRSCCGLPLLHAGDRGGLGERQAALVKELEGVELVVVADPGCALAVGALPKPLGAQVLPLVDLLYAKLDELPALALEGRQLRWHDPCQLGRGLGRYEEPRAILARLTGAPPLELPRTRAFAECSGAGGLLALTRPATSRAIGEERLREHRAGGGGTLVTACGESLRRFRSLGESAVDLLSLVAEARDM
jgi:dimethylglycine catabolism B